MSENISGLSSKIEYTEYQTHSTDKFTHVNHTGNNVDVLSDRSFQTQLSKSITENNALTKRADVLPTLNKPATPLTSLESLGKIMSTVKTMQSQYTELMNTCASLYNNTMSNYISDLYEEFEKISDEVISKQNEILSKQEQVSQLDDALNLLKDRLADISETDPRRQALLDEMATVEKKRLTLQEDIDKLTAVLLELEVEFVSQDEILEKLTMIISQFVKATSENDNEVTASTNELFNNVICNFLKFILSSANELQKTLRDIANKRADDAMERAQKAAREAGAAAAKAERHAQTYGKISKSLMLFASILGTVLAVATAVAFPAVGTVLMAVIAGVSMCVTAASSIYFFATGEESPIDKFFGELSAKAIDGLKKITELWLPKIVKLFGGSEEDCKNWVEGVALTAYVLIVVCVAVGMAVATGAGPGASVLGQPLGAATVSASTMITVETLRGVSIAANGFTTMVGSGLSIALSDEQKKADSLMAMTSELNKLMEAAFDMSENAMTQTGMLSADEQIENLRTAVEIMLGAQRKMVEA
ncbi:hypothetical protein [Escherichia coli]|uniref:hypothetical protein n=1 Tax=Escherichia coli TaxID=562 RepID=UPI000589B48F|nr:hypothetical protein [Escherichia coli]EEW6031440.1 hypothetical protein [Escherichia coli]EFC4872277.1 hypothetical protein [Escherichia coli]EGK3604192.1 hypothetical protein [Escherichia coli]EJJ0329255.1 hypothetical protein [Escherichia coli]EKY5128029.1 hypothetical protein [Escherichia coli]